MANKTQLAIPTGAHEVTGVLDRGSEFDGTLSFEGAFRIGGVFRGKIFTDDVLIIGEGAQVDAEIEVGTLILSGEFKGSVKAKDRVEIHYPAIFRGNIQSPSLMVADGVVFEGVSQMGRGEPGLEPSVKA
ncbi:MAG: bactofilin family protein [Bdellovibrionota bacterium]